MNRMRSRMRLDPFDLTRLDTFQLAPSAFQKTLPCNVTLPVRAVAKNSSPQAPTSRVMPRNGITNINPYLNTPSIELRPLLRNASKPTFPCNDGPSIGQPTGTKSQETFKRQRARHGTRCMIP